MKNQLVFGLVCLLIIQVYCEAATVDVNLQSHFIQELTHETFDKAQSQTKYVLVSFYDPEDWLSIKFAPNFWEASQTNTNSEVTFARVNLKQNPILKDLYKVNWVPSLYWFDQGKQSIYTGCRTVEAIATFVNNKVNNTKDSDPKTYCEFGFYGYPEEDHVLVLNERNFRDAIFHYKKVLVEFYTQWCGHCKNQAPIYADTAKKLKQMKTYIPLIKIDAEANKKLASDYGVSSYPTLTWLSHKNWHAYEAERTQNGILEYIKEKMTPKVRNITTEKQLEFHRNKHEVVVLYMGDDLSLLEVYGIFADSSKLIKSLKTNELELRKKHLGDETEGGIAIFRKFDEHVPVLLGDFDIDVLTTFVESNRYPKIMHFGTEESIHVFNEIYRPAIYLMFKDKKSHDEELMKVFEDTADLYQGKFIFMYTYLSEGPGQDIANYIGLKKRGCPAVRIIQAFESQDVHYYSLKNEITVDNLYTFIDDYNNNKLERDYKSQTAPRNNNESVKDLTTNTWQQEVMDNDADVVVEFYDPDCENCKVFKTVLQFTSLKLISMGNRLKFYKIHAYLNDVPAYVPVGFPTTLLYSGKDKKAPPKKYEGEMEVYPFMDWLKENRSFEVWKDAHYNEAEIEMLEGDNQIPPEQKKRIEKNAKNMMEDMTQENFQEDL